MNDKSKTSQAPAAGVQADSPRPKVVAVLAKAVLATLLLGGAVAATTYVLPHGAARQGDEISQSDARARLEAFNSLEPMNLSIVAAGDVDRALQSMQLNLSQAAALKANLDDMSAASQAKPATQGSVATEQAQTPSPAPVQATQQIRRFRLVWITLWDTDVEDGDVVRIDSQGYSRTIRLTKKGDTFAIPVPDDGVIEVTGISDGDGGGITVGLASGDAKAIFPIMSEGQQLGLKVKVN